MHDGGIVFEVRLRDSKRTAAPAEGCPLELAQHVAETPAALDGLIRSGQPVVCRERGEYTVAHAVTGRAALPHRKLAEPRLGERDIGNDGKRDRMCRLLRRETEEPRACDGAADHIEERVIESLLAREHVGEIAGCFVREHGRGEDGFTVALQCIRECEHARYRVAGMAARSREVGVVVVLNAHHHAVGKRGVLRRGHLLRAEKARRRGANGSSRKRPRDPAGLLVETADCATERIDQFAFRVVHDLRRQLFEA